MSGYGELIRVEPYQAFAAVTPSDVTVFAPPFVGLLIGVAGNVAITDMVGNITTLTGLQAGLIYPIKGTKVMATNTTATNIVTCYY
jgi:hypothetical protein